METSTYTSQRRADGQLESGFRDHAWSRLTSFVRKHPYLRATIDCTRSFAAMLNNERYFCTVCRRNTRLLPFGMPLRLNAACAACGSLERHRLLALLLDEQPELVAGGRVLHFAPEEHVCRLVRSLAPSDYMTADIEVGRAQMKLSIEAIDLPTASIDTLIVSHVLEHVDDRKALAEIYRVLAPNGTALIMVPIIEGWRSTYENPAITDRRTRRRHFGQVDHLRYYGSDLRERIGNCGLGLEEYTASAEAALIYGLIRGEKVFLAKKCTGAASASCSADQEQRSY